MAILVCGGAGYIGSHNVRALLARGETPVVLDNFLTGHRASVPGDVRLYTGDMRNPDLLDAVFSEQPIEAVLHFAASSLVGESMAPGISTDPITRSASCTEAAMLYSLEASVCTLAEKMSPR